MGHIGSEAPQRIAPSFVADVALGAAWWGLLMVLMGLVLARVAPNGGDGIVEARSFAASTQTGLEPTGIWGYDAALLPAGLFTRIVAHEEASARFLTGPSATNAPPQGIARRRMAGNHSQRPLCGLQRRLFLVHHAFLI